jgi:hypothetical protein
MTTQNSLQQGILQRIFWPQTANSADSAQNQQISTLQQGTVQGFTGISRLSIS